jgi:hypothetical protein
MFSFSRAKEYFDVRELQTMTGQPVERFPDVILKELLDNGADAVESAGRPPSISIRLIPRGRLLFVLVRDNGHGIAPDTVTRVLDFNTRTSDKAAYRAPTRGAQGNALKTVLGIPAALGVRAPVYVEARGVRHRIEAGLDPAGEVRVKHDMKDVPPRGGTLVAVALPADRCDPARFAFWGRAFALFNPHAAVRILNPGLARKHAYRQGRVSRNSYRPAVTFPGDWRKFLPTDLTSPWWFDEPALAKLLFGHIGAAEKGGRDLTLRDFVRTFRGLSGTAKAKAVCDRLPGLKRLTDFLGRERDVALLLEAMRAHTQPPSPGILGQVGEDSFRKRLQRWFGVKRWWYKKVAGVASGVPYVVEVALAKTERPGRLFHGVNFSPTFDDPLAGTLLQAPEFAAYGVAGFLERGHATRAAAAFHLICPVLETLDKGKTRLKVPQQVAADAAKALWSVVKDLYREEERRRKDAARQARADRRHEREDTEAKMFRKQACYRVMAEAVAKATGDGRYPVSAHTLFYHVRPLIQQYTDQELASDYFEQKVLPAYQREHGAIPGLYYEPRGTLYEPHTGVEVPLGTREVEAYRFPAWRYDKILFVEKTGLWPVLKAARLAERYDMAIVAGEGYATEACRVLLANAGRGRDYQLFVLHDADPHGYNIARTLRAATERMPDHNITVIDLGLKLQEALDLGLPAEHFTRRKELPRGLELTPLERAYFEGERSSPKSWLCRRVELNAFTAPDLIGYAGRGLRRNGARGKVIPDEQSLPDLAEELYSQVVGGVTDEGLARLLDVDAIRDTLGGELRRLVPLEESRRWATEAFAADGAISWEKAILAKIRAYLERRGEQVDGILRSLVSRAMERPE